MFLEMEHLLRSRNQGPNAPKPRIELAEQSKRAETGHLGKHTQTWEQGSKIGASAAPCYPLLFHQAC